jgi:serine/threonine-protein kinase
VLAQPDSFAYRTRKFVGRHRVGVATGGAVAVALVVSSLLALERAAEARRQAETARAQTALAQQESRRAHAVQAFLSDLFRTNKASQADPQAGQRTTARELLDRGAARVDQALAKSPQARIDILDTLALMYLHMHLHEQAAALQERRVALARQTFAANDPVLADALLSYASTFYWAEQRARVQDLLREARAVLDRAGAAGERMRGPLLIEEARYARYEPIAVAIRSADDAVAHYGRSAPAGAELVTAHLLAGHARASAGDLDGAAAQAALAIAAAERQGAAAPAWLIAPSQLLGEIDAARGRCVEAETRMRAAIAATDHVHGPDILSSQHEAWLGNLLLEVGRSAEGEAALAHARSTNDRPDPRKTARWRENAAAMLGALDGERGRPDRLVDTLRRQIASERREMPRSAKLAQHLRELAGIETDLGDVAAARATMAEADAVWRSAAAGASTAPMDARFALARAHVALASGDPAAALADLAPDAPALPADAISREIERSAALRASGRAEESVAAADAALGRIEALPASCRPVSLRARALERRAEALRDRGDAAGALRDFQAAAGLRRGHDLDGSRWLARLDAAIASLPARRVATRRSP